MARRVTLFLIITLLVTAKSYSQALQCAVFETLTPSPQPVNNTYLTGQTVSFCYSLQGWTEYGANYLHGFALDFGPGWDTTSFTALSLPGSCDGFGNWKFYKTDTSLGTGKTFGMGFYYDKGVGLGGPNGKPGDNYGDHTITGTCVWNFCFSVKVRTICNGSDLSVSVSAMGDGTSGAWSNISCPGIPMQAFSSPVTCVPNCNMVLTVTPSKAACAISNGTVTSTLTGGTSPYKYSWNTGQKTQNIAGLTSGIYQLTVTDGNQCTINASTTVTVNNPVNVSISSTDVSCFGFCDGSAMVSPSSGQAPYTYLWDPAGVTQKITGLCAGTYNVIVSDANNCTKSASATVNQFINLMVNPTTTSTACSGSSDGTASVTASFGNSPYTYKWFNTETTATISNLKAGVYHVTVTDAKGCYLDVTALVQEPQAISISPAVINVSCYGLSDGSITLNPTNGVAPYEYLWDSGSTTNSISNLKSGVYSVTVTDANTCKKKGSYFITQPPAFGGKFRQEPTSCPEVSNGIAEVIPYGGVTPYSYLWKIVPPQTTAKVTNLASGTYTIQVTDQNGCKFELTDEVKTLPLFKVSAGGDKEIGKFKNTRLSASVNQPGNYSLVWTPVTDLSDPEAVNPIASPTVTTTYVLTVVNQDNGCTAIDSIIVLVLPTDYLYLPNAFSPNDDGQNDLFFPIAGELIEVIDFKIFNRWGQKVYEGVVGGWDGQFKSRNASEGAYAYYVVYRNISSSVEYQKQGSVTLMR